MQLKINCKMNKDGAYCLDRRVGKSLFGIGARTCRVFDGKKCEFQDKSKKPQIDVPAQRPKVTKNQFK